eukprot:GHVR01073116.1.p1 GENE.GHVR01073116.1~~GHVR01073116.1.p1  ORF type:complete len:221 (-),score=-5.11 GHVR01073116.1:70-732(-)
MGVSHWPQVFVGTTAPAGYQGQLWFNSSTGKTYIYFDDGTSAQWVSAIGGLNIASSDLPAGTILQVVSTHYTGTFSTASPTPSNVTGFAATITPSSTSSKILVMFQSNVGYSANDNYPYFLMDRNGTSIGTGAAGTGVQINTFASVSNLSADAISTEAYKRQSVSRSYVDSPASTSSLTYQVQFAEAYSGTSYVNRTENALNATYIQFPGSDLILMEVAG